MVLCSLEQRIYHLSSGLSCPLLIQLSGFQGFPSLLETWEVLDRIRKANFKDKAVWEHFYLDELYEWSPYQRVIPPMTLQAMPLRDCLLTEAGCLFLKSVKVANGCYFSGWVGEKALAFTRETLSNTCMKVQVVPFLLYHFALSFVF